MRIRNVKNAKEILDNSKIIVKEPHNYKDKLSTLFGNNHPIHLEIGMGKGNFLLAMSKLYPDINFIGIERYDSIVCRACKKLEETPNVKIFVMDASHLLDVIGKEITTLYLNFSDPWPKKRQEKRRLTSSNFLSLYDHIFINNPHIIMKTDNKDLFAYSLASLSEYGYTLKNVSLDLEHSEIVSPRTEYQMKFKDKEYINYLEAVKEKE